MLHARTLLMLCFFSPICPGVHGQFTYQVSNGNVWITGYTGAGGAVSIPETIEGRPVERIHDQAFFRCDTVTSVTIPRTVFWIGWRAFGLCTNLTNFTAHPGEGPWGVTLVDGSVFEGCTSLVTVILPRKLTSVGNAMFADCRSLRDFAIPDSVTGIGTAAFLNCTNLAEAKPDAHNHP
jgi:hypothetical protein